MRSASDPKKLLNSLHGGLFHATYFQCSEEVWMSTNTMKLLKYSLPSGDVLESAKSARTAIIMQVIHLARGGMGVKGTL